MTIATYILIGSGWVLAGHFFARCADNLYGDFSRYKSFLAVCTWPFIAPIILADLACGKGRGR